MKMMICFLKPKFPDQDRSGVSPEGRRWFVMGHSTSQQNPAPYSHSLAGSPEWGSELDFLRSGIPVGIVFSNSGTTVFQEELQEG